MLLGEKIRKYREQKGYTFYELGKRSGISQDSLKKIELSLQDPQYATVEILAQALDLSVSELVNESDVSTQLSPEEAEFLDGFRALNSRQKIFIKSALDILRYGS